MSVLAVLLLAFLAMMASDDVLAVGTDRVSVATGGGQAIGSSAFPVLSADGRFVAFQTTAALDAADSGSSSDVYIRDTTLNQTTLVSRATGAAGAKGNNQSSAPSISSDGRYVAFTSEATNLDPAATNATISVFVRDLVANTTKLVSRASGVSGAEGTGHDSEPSVSADGRYVAFTSSSTNFDPLDLTNTNDVYVRDLVNNSTALASRNGGTKANGFSNSPAISGDGRYVAFNSDASNLDPDDTCACGDVYVLDTLFQTATLVSRPDGTGAGGNGASGAASVSFNGRYIAFDSIASNLDPADTDAISDVFVRDTLANVTKLVSRATGAAGAKANVVSDNPWLSSTGRFVAFNSDAANLDSNDSGDFTDIFLRDLQMNATLAISLTNAGAHGDNISLYPAVATDGTTVFHSMATSLVAGDTNSTWDVFRVDDVDRDGMTNGFESATACLQPTIHDAGSDGDYDGLLNGAEVSIGLNPCSVDTDFDLRADTSDQCPFTPEDIDAHEDGNGCPDVDNDMDGICDDGQSATGCTGTDSGRYEWERPEEDPVDCRNVAEDYDGFHDDDGCPEADNDYDGFPDSADDCPATDATVGDDGRADTGDEPVFYLTPYQSREDFDGVLDWDGCHDSPDDDYDGDGAGDETEVFTMQTDPMNPDTDADTVVDGTDNCPNWANASQGVPSWAIPAQDSDCDGWNKTREQHVGTDPTTHCNATSTLNDEPDFWPTDFNDSKFTNLADVSSFNPTYNKFPGDAGYSKRHDLNASNGVTLADVSLMNLFYNKPCS